MCKEGWSVRLGQEGVAWGRTVWNSLKGGRKVKREGETKIFKKGAAGKLGEGVGALKRCGGLESP